MQQKYKILIVGPSRAGKTTLSNVISGQSEHPSNIYHPTSGVRILEIDKEPPRANRRAGESNVQIEIWDCAGDPRYEKCWSAFRKDANGVIFVFDSEESSTDMDHWVRNFPQRIGIPPTQCIAFAHFKSGKPKGSLRPPRGLEKVLMFESSLENTSSIHLAFDKLFATIYSNFQESQERAEKEIMNAH